MKDLFNIFLTIPINDLPAELKNTIPEKLQLKSLILIGSGGPQMWSHFKKSKNTLDDFSKAKIIDWGKSELNEDLSGQFLYPNDENNFPLQKLSRYLKFSYQSPLGIDISLEFGLWFAFRGLVATKKEMASQDLKAFTSPCESCSHKPCLDEMKNISKARLLCPYQINMRYSNEQILFHERALGTSIFPPRS